MKPIINLQGQTFGRLIVLELKGRVKRRTVWFCKCECGNITTKASSDLLGGKSKSCGCLVSENLRQIATKHGEYKTREYHAWKAMKQRCSPKGKRAKDYFERGIRICSEWSKSYVAFLKDVGRCPAEGLTLDRINNNGNYEPGNVRWATYTEQRHNRRR